MDPKRSFDTANTLDSPRPRLISRPAGWTLEDVERWLVDVDQTWNTLARHGSERLHEGGWRRLGVGAIQHVSAVFERLAGPPSVAWSTLDARDDWNQTVVQIALRQRCWFTPRTRPILRALSNSLFDLYRVATHTSGRLVLERATDGRTFGVHATFDDGAYPRDRYVVARLVVDGAACASIASAVVSGREIHQATRHGAPTTRVAWSQLLFDIILDRFSRVAAEGRHDVVDPVFVSPGPRRTRRLHRAFDAIEAGMTGRTSPSFRFSHREWTLFVEANEVVAVPRSGARRHLRRLPEATFATVDREVARQAGICPSNGLIHGLGDLSLPRWQGVLDALARAARRLHRSRGKRAA
jgi:hypothetical protein